MNQELFFRSFNFAMYITFIHAIFSFEGMIFFRLGLRVERSLGSTFCKPVFSCMTCMSFWYGVALNILCLINNKWSVGLMVMTGIACGICTVVSAFIDKKNIESQFNGN